jgi:hypothetical protein
MRPSFVTAPARFTRAWLYVRFFIRYEMTRCSLDAKVEEGRV